MQSGEIVDPHFLPIIFEADPSDTWDDEATWAKVLPGLPYGYPDLPSMRQLAREAKERPGDRAAFEQFFLGRRQDNSLSPFVQMAVFDEGRTEIDIDALAGRECWVAGDMASTTDLAAIVACFKDGDDLIVKCWAFVPADNLQARADRDGVQYPRWAKEGWLIPTPGNVIDYRVIEQHVRDLCDKYDVREIVFDPAYSAAVLSPLVEDGMPAITMQQGWKTQSPALNDLERAITGRRLKWDSPILRWCMENVAIHTDTAGNRLMHKGKSKDRIDLAVALWMAISRASAGDAGVSIYSSDARPDGLLFV
ncbi:terminase TerL endonuclease subunit [Rhodopseudomonas sp. P2A-2r]|uniref:terminase TerL endonuclease subunit n=1 Tax=Rhodopseudomonas sp. P2A-2r TaxID=2991972 RepID=UPI0029FEDC87|nr:terminase TerL endonuclease subunit [Rhodopseudomonas sp. P2A-2r]